MTNAAVQIEDKKSEGVSILDKSICLAIRFSRFGNRRKASMVHVSVNAEKSMLALSKRLIHSKQYTAIGALDIEIKRHLQKLALPFPVRHGSYLVPIPMISPIETDLMAFKAKRDALIEEFLLVYPEQKAAVEQELRDLYNPMDYPSVDAMRAKFAMEWNYLDYGVPGRLKAINATMFEEARAKMESKIAAATEEVQQALRAGMLELVEHAVERLQPDADGKPKVFRNTLVVNLQEFLNTFDVRNITNDAELKSLVDKARGLLTGVDAEQIRKQEGLREALAKGFADIKTTMGGLVTERTRKITLEDDDEGEGV